ncbi:DNA-binding protein [Acidovorax sp. A1169]|uniref:DNA-binding protein n=1 Tax=Acidovorax sp. A1169 TaxID=3059524 RepID=UPI00273795E2|nr:DNA-binding protein [Acidovorax sp. A1169]MDP4078804.1 DNA-binding protein [Acidovorax sp. A1169]
MTHTSQHRHGSVAAGTDALNAAREKFDDHGISIACWARERGFSAALVYSVLNGKSQARRGESFRIGVALGLRKPPSGDLFGRASVEQSTRV